MQIKERSNLLEDQNVALTKVTEYIFAPFHTYVFLDLDELKFNKELDVPSKLINSLNSIPITNHNLNAKVQWNREDSNELKKAKGVFANQGQSNSLIYAELIPTEGKGFPILEKVSDKLPQNALSFEKVRFYFRESGVGTCSAKIQIESIDDFNLIELEHISESINKLFKVYFEDICFELTQAYSRVISELSISAFSFDFMPTLKKENKEKACIPWTHRIYHIHDERLFELDNPGQPFKYILTPSKKEDIVDLSIYEDKYIYFGWGHSLILTKDTTKNYVQTQTQVKEYVRLVEIAQSNWQCFDLLSNIVDLARYSFSRNGKKLSFRRLKRDIYEIRFFNKYVDQILDDAREIRVTFDTEKRNLLVEMQKRWNSLDMLSNVQEKMALVENMLDFLYHRLKEQRDDTLNVVLLFITILSMSQIIAIIIDYTQEIFQFSPYMKLFILGNGVLATLLSIFLILRSKS
ncbi:hypothetical protein [Salinibacillus xinjiangensis]|uniref:Uncharacterized protein n=1 Tax=Salinibacillus xinjiangensis TaxID=1229268 RepID=A0A6G1X5V9_9BACI|nr:hypothetical protein [Salinibacillus xinjiangensis]MRG86354.1 hypothetical protein [Salinibacillus xinjiangensis]